MGLKIQSLGAIPSGINLDHSTPEYQTLEVDSLFRITSELSMVSEDVKQFPTDLSEESVSVHYSDEISNRLFIIDFVKVADFIEEMDGFILLNASV